MSQEIQESSNIYFVAFQKEIVDSVKLVEDIKASGWIDSSVIIVNCMPDYSSVVSQVINHKLSHLNNNELYEQIPLEVPYPGMTQVWNRGEYLYEMFDRYLVSWINHNLSQKFKYLFVTSSVRNAAIYNKIRSAIRDKTADYKFASLYTQDNFKPDFSVDEVADNRRIIFEWENTDNPNYIK